MLIAVVPNNYFKFPWNHKYFHKIGNNLSLTVLFMIKVVTILKSYGGKSRCCTEHPCTHHPSLNMTFFIQKVNKYNVQLHCFTFQVFIISNNCMLFKAKSANCCGLPGTYFMWCSVFRVQYVMPFKTKKHTKHYWHNKEEKCTLYTYISDISFVINIGRLFRNVMEVLKTACI